MSQDLPPRFTPSITHAKNYSHKEKAAHSGAALTPENYCQDNTTTRWKNRLNFDQALQLAASRPVHIPAAVVVAAPGITAFCWRLIHGLGAA